MAYWLIKSEPYKWSWDQQVADKTTYWDGVRNYQARNNMMAMKKGDQCFFYHSNEGKEIVGIVDVTGEHYPDPTDESGKFVVVDVTANKALKTPVTLADIKAHPDLQDIALVRQGRLSVCPITDEEWKIICEMGGV